jgi:hypothetical protein
LSSISAKDDDFVVVLLLLSHQFPLIASVLSQSKLKQFLPLSEIAEEIITFPDLLFFIPILPLQEVVLVAL